MNSVWADYGVGGSYHDELVRTPDGWRIRSRVCEQTIRAGLPEDYVIPG